MSIQDDFIQNSLSPLSVKCHFQEFSVSKDKIILIKKMDIEMDYLKA